MGTLTFRTMTVDSTNGLALDADVNFSTYTTAARFQVFHE